MTTTPKLSDILSSGDNKFGQPVSNPNLRQRGKEILLAQNQPPVVYDPNVFQTNGYNPTVNAKSVAFDTMDKLTRQYRDLGIGLAYNISFSDDNNNLILTLFSGANQIGNVSVPQSRLTQKDGGDFLKSEVEKQLSPLLQVKNKDIMSQPESQHLRYWGALNPSDNNHLSMMISTKKMLARMLGLANQEEANRISLDFDANNSAIMQSGGVTYISGEVYAGNSSDFANGRAADRGKVVRFEYHPQTKLLFIRSRTDQAGQGGPPNIPGITHRVISIDKTKSTVTSVLQESATN